MPPVLPVCPEGCGERLKHATHKTCGSRSCQGKRHRRLKKQREEQARAMGSESPYTPEVQDVAHAASPSGKGATPQQRAVVAATRDVAREVIRESMTQDVVASLQGMLLLVPKAIETLDTDLKSTDPYVRERARELVLRYTLGHKSITPPPTEQQTSPMTVVLNVPGSGATVEAAMAKPELDPADVVEVRECMECNVSKPEPEFVAGSDRCQTCHDDKMDEIKARFG